MDPVEIDVVSSQPLEACFNLASFDLTLSADQLKTLYEASRIELGFPHDMYAKEMVRALAYGGLREQILVEWP